MAQAIVISLICEFPHSFGNGDSHSEVRDVDLSELRLTVAEDVSSESRVFGGGSREGWPPALGDPKPASLGCKFSLLLPPPGAALRIPCQP